MIVCRFISKYSDIEKEDTVFKMGIRKLFVRVWVLNWLTQIVSSEIIQVGTNHTIECKLDVEYPSWDKLNVNRSGSVMITYAGGETINPDFYAKERIRYSSNNRDLVLSNVTFKDAGTYQCSKAQKGKSVSIIDVDDLKLNVNCRGEYTSGIFSATTGCLSPDAVTFFKWIYIFGDGSKVANYRMDMNETGCFDGKARLTSWFEYRTVFCIRDQQVSVQLLLYYNAKTQTIDCRKKCILDGYTEDYYIGCIVVFTLHTVTSVIGVLCHFKKHKCERCVAIVSGAICLFVLQIVLFVLVTVFPPKPDKHFRFDFSTDMFILVSMSIFCVSLLAQFIRLKLIVIRTYRSIRVAEETMKRWKILKDKLNIATHDELANKLIDCAHHLELQEADCLLGNTTTSENSITSEETTL